MKKINKDKVFLVLVVILGIIIRLVFMLKIPIYNLQYDIGVKNISKDIDYNKFFELDRNYVKENGNMEYLITIYKTGHLLESNTNQGYHPPLHHYIAAGIMKVVSFFCKDSKVILESAEIPAFIYSIVIIILIYKITKELRLNNTSIILIMLLTSFNPSLIFLSREINNDPLVTLCTIISILYLIKWYKEPNVKYTLLLALAIGLGASSKISIIVMIIPSLITYFVKLWKESENWNNVKRILVYGIIFSIIVIPLILWYPIRNAIKFDQPIFGILNASEEFLVANTDFGNRWLINKEIFSNKLELSASNVWAYVINSYIIFELDIAYLPNVFLHTMRTINIILIIIAILSMIKSFKENYVYKLLNAISLTWLLSFIYFNISLPYSCTMHSRYIITIFLIGIIFIGRAFEKYNNKYIKFLIDLLAVLYSLGTLFIFTKLFIIF